MADAQRSLEAEDEMVARAIALSMAEEEEKQRGKSSRKISGVKRRWSGPSAEFLEELLKLGFSNNAAEKALFATGNKSVKEAHIWLENHKSDQKLDEPREVEEDRMLELAAVELNKGKKRCPYKMVFVVNADLGMGIGKACVQIGHASIGMHKTLLGNPQKYRDMLIEWEEYGETKEVLQGYNTPHLMDLEDLMKENDLPTYLVHDVGQRQVTAGAVTVLALFGETDKVSVVTAHLKPV